MKDKYEIEYSFISTNPDTVQQLRKDFVATKVYDIADAYSDTEDRLLSKNKYVFRERVQEGRVIYTLKGPASGTNPPKRLELETDDMNDILSEILTRIPDAGTKVLVTMQERYTRREEYEFKHYGFTMYIDTTKFDNGAQYVNIEVEGDMVEHMNEFRAQLLERDGIREWKPSKFQVGEAVKALNMTGDLSTEDLHKIEIYLGNKEKRNKK